MGVRDDIDYLLPRGMNQSTAMRYLGVKRRAFDSLKNELRPIKIGTSLVYDRHDLDALLDRLMLKRVHLPSHPDALASSDGPSIDRATLRAIPTDQGTPWPVKAASTKSQVANGASTKCSGVSAFRAVSDLIKRQNRG